MTRIAVTGAVNFVRSHVVQALSEAGHTVHDAAFFHGSSISDVRSTAGSGPSELEHDLHDVETVVHIGGSFGSQDGEPFDAVLATRNVVDVARASGNKRFIHLGCMSAGAGTHSHYLREQWKAESIVRSVETDLPSTILRPSLVLGRGDGVTDALAAWMRMWPVIPVPGRGQERVQPVDVGDLAKCVVRALDDEFAGEIISVGGPNFLTYRQLADLVGGVQDTFRPKLLLSPHIFRALGPIMPAAARSLVEPQCLDLFLTGGAASPGIVQRHFGFEPRPVHSLLAEYLT